MWTTGPRSPPISRSPRPRQRPAVPRPGPAAVAWSRRRSRRRPASPRQPAATRERASQGTAVPERVRRSSRATDLTEQFDVRAARSGGRYSAEPADENLAALARLADQPPSAQRSGASAGPAAAGLPRSGGGQRPASGQRPARVPLPQAPLPQAPLPQAPAAPISPSGGHARLPIPLDDDPLTSPSFPAINTSDSRSYRGRRSSGSQASGPSPVPGGPAPATSGGSSRRIMTARRARPAATRRCRPRAPPPKRRRRCRRRASRQQPTPTGATSAARSPATRSRPSPLSTQPLTTAAERPGGRPLPGPTGTPARRPMVRRPPATCRLR